MRSKRQKDVLACLSDSKIKSTNEIVKEVKETIGKSINWYVVYRILSDLGQENKVERLESKGGVYWRKK